MNQPQSSRDGSPSPDAAIGAPSGGVGAQPGPSVPCTTNNLGYQINAFPSVEHYHFGGHDSNTGSWSGFPWYASADGLRAVPPVIYGDNSAFGLRSPYGFNPQTAHGQYSLVSRPAPPVVVDNQFSSPQQIPFSPSYHPQAGATSMPHISAPVHVSQDLMNVRDNQFSSPQQIPFSPSYHPQAGATSMPHISAPVHVSQDLMNVRGNHPVDSRSNASLYNLHGRFTPNPMDLPRRTISPMTSAGAYTQPMGTYGSYYQNAAQASRRSPVSSEFFPWQHAYDISNQGTSFGRLPSPQQPFGYPSQVPSFVVSGDRSRGPRSMKVKGKSNVYCPDFPTESHNAKCFIIKSLSEDNIHRSIKYGVWASTTQGNKRLDDAYREAKRSGNCPLYLFFSVNGSTQFCGVAEMVGPVDFEKKSDYWEQDRWKGEFPVTWLIVKDVPNSEFRHIILENNDNKPVTHSRDCQEVKWEKGREMLKIFKEHEGSTCILEDFEFYDEQERVLREWKKRMGTNKPNEELNNAAAAAAGGGVMDTRRAVGITVTVTPELSVNINTKCGLDFCRTPPGLIMLCCLHVYELVLALDPPCLSLFALCTRVSIF